MKAGDIVVHNGAVGEVIHIGENFAFRPVNWGLHCSSDLDIITESDVKEATHDQKLNFIKSEHEHMYGKVIDIHCVENYQFVEYEHKWTNEHLCHVFIDYRDTSNFYESLDSALVELADLR